MMIEVIPLLAVVLLLLYFVYRYWSLVRFRRLLLEALVRRDVDLVYGLVRGRPGLARRVGAAVLGEVFNFLFFRGEFEKFVELTRVVGVDDPRARILDLDVDVVALDVETEVVFERRPREIGFVAIRSRDWSVAFRLRVSDFKALVDKYGVEPRNFLRKFLGRFRVVVGHNVFLHDLEVLRGWGVDLCVPLIDTYLLSLLVVPEARFHSLEYLSDVFGVDYTPHVADEDAYASAMILPYLVGIAKSKGLLDAIVSVDYYPLVGLKVINVPSREFVFRRSRFKCSSSFEVAVVFDAYDCVDAWYPLVVSREKLAALGSSLYSMSDRLALIIVESYLRGGGRSVDELRELYIPYRSIADSLRDILDRVCVENPLPDLRSGFSVEYRHLYDLISRWRIGGGKAGRIRFVGAYLLKVYCGGRLGEVLSWAKDNFNEVVFHTVFPQDFDLYDVLIEAPEKPPRVLRVVEEGLDKSSRHFRYLGRILASIVSEGCSLVVVANRAEEFIARDAAFKVKGKAIVLNVGGSKALKVLRYMRRFAGWRYSVVLYSLRTLRARLASTRRLEEFLKMLIEASYYGGIGLTVLNAKYGILSSVGLHDYVDHITVMPRDDVDVELSYVVFDSLDDALRRVEEVVAEKWGFRLRPYQRRCVARLLLPYCREGSRVNMPLTIVLLPTGSGKSLIFQSVARVLRRRIGGTTVVVSPLLALIEDQVYSLRRRGIRVCRITGLVDSSTRSRLIRGLARGEYDLVYITPEQFQKEIVRRSFEKADINYVILDEIHTLSKWGRSFRPSYMYLAEYLRKRRSEGFWIPIAGFTATLPSSELEAVLKFLSGAEGFDIDEIDFSTDYDRSVAEMRFQVKVIKGPVLRDNITINVMAAPAGESKLRYLAKVVRDLIDWSEEVSGGRPWIGIVYTGFVRSTREYENVETIAEYLSQVLNEKVGYFHGQLDRREKKRILDSLYMVSRGVIRYPRIIVATKAFGMGVDIPNIRWIVHYIMPETVEDYYQEIGRGGRDGELCRAVMLFSPGYDFRRRYTLLKRGFIDPRVVFVIHEFLARYAGTDARIPLVILCLLVHNFMYGNTWKYVAYGRTLPERVDTCVRKSLNLMARLGILDYDIIYDRFVVTDDEVSAGVRIAKIGNKDLYLATLKDVKHDGSLYDAYVVGLYGGYDALVKFIPEGLPGNLRLLIKPAGGNGEELGLRITGAKEAVLINYLVPQINRRDAYDLVRREQFYEMVALFYMNNYAETVVSKPADERDKVARMLIKEYLSRSIKDLYREFISEKKMKLAYVDTEVFRMYNTLIKKGRLNLWVRYRDKKMLAEFMAYLTLIHFLEKEYPPNSIAVVLPYGYRSSFVESFRELYGMLGMPLIEPETVIVKRSDIYRLKDIVLDLSRMPQVFILASNYTLKRLAYDLENSSGSGVYTVCVKR